MLECAIGFVDKVLDDENFAQVSICFWGAFCRGFVLPLLQ